MKKCLSIILMFFLIFSSSVVLLAEEETITQNSPDNSDNITVDYDAGVTYTVTIPANVTFTDTEKEIERSMQIRDVVLNEGSTLHVNLTSRNDFKMMYGKGYIEYQLMINSHDISQGNDYTILSVPSGESSGWAILKFTTDLQKDHVLYTGNYADTLTFTVSID